MGNLFRLNPFYEWELLHYPSSYTVQPGLASKANSLEYLFIPILKEDDELFLSQNPIEEFLEYASEKWKKKIKITHSLNTSKELIEWGKYFKSTPTSTEIDQKTILLHKKLSSKLFQDNFRQRHLKNCPIRNQVFGTASIQKFIHEQGFPFVLKPDFGLSGVLSWIIGSQEEYEKSFIKIGSVIKESKYFIESWKKRVSDFSGLFDSNSGLLGLTQMVISKQGIYRGSKMIINDIIKNQMIYIYSILQSERILPKGAFSIDGFFYEENQEVKECYFSEINTRWTMGRILYEITNIINLQNIQLEFINNSWKKGTSLTQIESEIKNERKSNMITILTPPFLREEKVSSIGILIG